MLETARQIELGWDEHYELARPAFVLETRHREIGARMLMGYPLEEMRRVIHKTQDFQARFAALFSEELSIEITTSVANDMIVAGWDWQKLHEAPEAGMRYSPSRNTFLTPMIRGGFDTEFDDE